MVTLASLVFCSVHTHTEQRGETDSGGHSEPGEDNMLLQLMMCGVFSLNVIGVLKDNIKLCRLIL